MKRNSHSKVMTIANRLVKQGYGRSTAMIKAWVLVKLPGVVTKVSGVTHGKRQQALEHLTQYSPEDIRIYLKRESDNAFDKNAVKVVVSVRNKGAYTIGYLPRALAAFIAPLLDTGKIIKTAYSGVVGMYEPYMNYGLRITLAV